MNLETDASIRFFSLRYPVTILTNIQRRTWPAVRTRVETSCDTRTGWSTGSPERNCRCSAQLQVSTLIDTYLDVAFFVLDLKNVGSGRRRVGLLNDNSWYIGVRLNAHRNGEFLHDRRQTLLRSLVGRLPNITADLCSSAIIENCPQGIIDSGGCICRISIRPRPRISKGFFGVGIKPSDRV